MKDTALYIEQLNRLRTTGSQFDQKPLRIPLGEGITHLDWKGNQVPVLVNKQLLERPTEIFAQDKLVQSKIDQLRGKPSASVLNYLDAKIKDPRLIIGFSGYASDGFGYEIETDGIEIVLQSFKQNALGLVVDGGTNLGVPALSSLIANQREIETLGVLPLEGLRSLGEQDTLIVLGKQYGDETELIGRLPDVLFILGGGPNATREYMEALNAGNSVIMMKLKSYPDISLANTFESVKETAEAKETGKLTICTNLEQVQDAVNSLSTATILNNRKSKSLQLQTSS